MGATARSVPAHDSGMQLSSRTALGRLHRSFVGSALFTHHHACGA
jgi:hypothetical protein